MIPCVDGRQRAARAVAARRGELDMTQQALADAAGVNIKTIGSLERRGRWPIARTRTRIEKALGWPGGELERIASEEPEEAPDPVPPEVREAIYRTLPPDRAARIEAVVEEALRGGRPPRREGKEPRAGAG